MSIYRNIARRLAWHSKFEKRKAPRKELNEELMLVAWHLGWNFSMPDDKKEIETIFLKHFATQRLDIVQKSL